MALVIKLSHMQLRSVVNFLNSYIKAVKGMEYNNFNAALAHRIRDAVIGADLTKNTAYQDNYLTT